MQCQDVDKSVGTWAVLEQRENTRTHKHTQVIVFQ